MSTNLTRAAKYGLAVSLLMLPFSATAQQTMYGFGYCYDIEKLTHVVSRNLIETSIVDRGERRESVDGQWLAQLSAAGFKCFTKEPVQLFDSSSKAESSRQMFIVPDLNPNIKVFELDFDYQEG